MQIKSGYILTLIALSLSLFSINCFAADTMATLRLNPNANPVMTAPSPPKLTAKSYLLVDYNSNQILAENNQDQKVAPASLTKMMTVYVADKALANHKIALTDEVLISEKAWRTPGSRMFVEVNTKVSVEKLIKGIIIQSGNDASIALAEHVAGSEQAFVELMNNQAKILGMTSTHFSNATGLHRKNHYSTAHDLAILAKAIIADFPESYSLYASKWFTYNDIRQPNRNRLLWRDDSVDGLKTGHTEKAGYCLVASAKRNGMRLISVIIGTGSDSARSSQSQQLLNFGFRFYKTYLLYNANTALTKTRVWLGATEYLELGITDNLYVTIPDGQYDQLAAKVTIENVIKAPITSKTNYGSLAITLGDKAVTKVPLLALHSVAKGSFWSRSSDYISMFLHNILSSDTQEQTKTI